MIDIHVAGRQYGAIVYAEAPLLNDPAASSTSPYALTVPQRAAVVSEALKYGVTLFLASTPAAVQTLSESLTAANAPESARVAIEVAHGLCDADDREDAGRSSVESDFAKAELSPLASRIDFLLLNDITEDLLDSRRLSGAVAALKQLKAAGKIRAWGLTCYRDHDAAAEVVQHYAPDLVIARCNAADLNALRLLVPRCEERGIPFIATQTIAWAKGVPFVRFSNTWRLRNMLMNFYGVSAVQAHTRWLLHGRGIGGVACTFNEQGQPQEVCASAGAGKLIAPPPGMETALSEFISAITRSDEGWTILLSDPYWVYRAAASDLLGP
ncbi:MAG TPA: aldo/keto reductase [Capsulimonadaceae bacterium]|jgi:diketogulonate reductase-like aldo/keto reductase